MNENINQTLRDNKKLRWTALVILSFTMFAGYLFTEIISPLKPILERTYGWNSADFGIVTSFYGFFNVWFLMLIIVGVLLDKFGIRISTVASVIIMILGGAIKYMAFKMDFDPSATVNLLFFQMKTRVFMASMGYALFGVGVEYAGITVSKSLVKWFKGKEMALAMGMQVAIARMGSAIPLFFGAYIANLFDVPTVIIISVSLLVAGLFAFFYYNSLDKKLDQQLGESETETEEEEGFKLSDLGIIFKNRGFWLIALLCVLFYSAVFPFYKYGTDLMVNKFGVSETWAGLFPGLVPLGTMLLTPLFGGIYDKKGRGVDIMILGAVILIVVHLIFYLPFINSVYVAFINVILLGIAFSLVPSAMWPSVPKIIPEKQLGSAYAAIFWVQNFGLWGIPLLVGIVLNSTNPTISPDKINIQDGFVKAYQEVVMQSPLKDATNITGKKMTDLNIESYAKGTSGNLVSKVIVVAPQEEVAKIDPNQLKDKIYTETKRVLQSYINDSLDVKNISKIENKENVAFRDMNNSVINQMTEVIKNEKIKLNYNYQKTWTIFVILTIFALIVSMLLKAEDKRKQYGLQLPNIENQKKDNE